MNRLVEGTRNIALKLTPAQLLLHRRHRAVMNSFAEKNGMVYFGFVSQRDDDHHLVRGLTLSSTHRDDHYCIGSSYGYDITLLERIDTIRSPGKASQEHRWVIMEFDLHAPYDLPHIFLGLHTHSPAFYHKLFTTFTSFSRVQLGTFGLYSEAFSDRYTMYTTPDHAIEAQQLIDPAAAKLIAAHFGTLTVEINDGCLYLYAEHKHLTETLLDAMLQNGIWLAKHLDVRIKELYEPIGLMEPGQ